MHSARREQRLGLFPSEVRSHRSQTGTPDGHNRPVLVDDHRSIPAQDFSEFL
jgi:hypothetical protein